MLALLYRMLSQSLLAQKLARTPEPAAVMVGERCEAYDTGSQNDNILAVYDFCADLLEASGPTHGRVLDIACGTGQFLFTLAERMPGLQLVGLDASLDMLDICQQRADGCSEPGRFSFIHGDMSDFYCFPDGHFDLTTWTYAAHHTRSLDEVAVTLKELARVTRPEGAILVLDLGRLKTPALNDWYVGWAGRHYSPALLAEFRDSMNAAYTTAELRALVGRLRIQGLEHYAVAGLPVLQVLYRPAQSAARAGDAPPHGSRQARHPDIMKDYKQLSFLFRLGGLEPRRTS